MAEHAQSGISVVHAPNPGRLLVWSVMGCGCWRLFTPPPCFDLQANIEAWFEARRGLKQDWGDAR